MFLEENPFCEGSDLVWCEPDDHPFFRSILSAKCPFFYSSFSSNHPGAKSLVQHGIESIPYPQPAATTFAFSPVWFFMAMVKRLGSTYTLFNLSAIIIKLYGVCGSRQNQNLFLGLSNCKPCVLARNEGGKTRACAQCMPQGTKKRVWRKYIFLFYDIVKRVWCEAETPILCLACTKGYGLEFERKY